MERMKSALGVFRQLPIVVDLPTGGKLGAKLFAAPVPGNAGGKPPGNVPRGTKKDLRQPLTGCSSILSIPLPNNGNYDGEFLIVS